MSESYMKVEKQEKLKVVLDTNIYISSFYWKLGNPNKIIDKAIDKKIEVFVSDEILIEIRKILVRDFKESDESIDSKINFVLGFANLIDVNDIINLVKEDEDDNKIVECALSANTDYIVSGDAHLLNLKEHNGIKIVSPAEFMRLFE